MAFVDNFESDDCDVDTDGTVTTSSSAADVASANVAASKAVADLDAVAWRRPAGDYLARWECSFSGAGEDRRVGLFRCCCCCYTR